MTAEATGEGRRAAVLLEAARSGDRDALNALVRQVSPMLWHVARAQGLDRDSCFDVVQHAWIALLGALPGIRTPDALIGWLVTVTRREAWRLLRSQRRSAPVDTDALAETPHADPTPEERLVAAEADLELWTTLKRLPPRCQQLLRIVAFVHRPSTVQVASVLGVARGSVGPLRGRCLKKLRSLLTADTETGGALDEHR
ncbi:sigma-70 family RNA polymerase sigma factor [Saccharothrix sp. NPDC042600]|uniref:RNA polymerase sigma factor n=1 Tax=Saccharothrix TaxID=2071 RepID=UPI00340665C4|nr:sigma-70 family RNA polymerase sigma factor [Saccharothrix mutabilis subsp. capreolus]